MDDRLVAWGRAVKVRQGGTRQGGVPPLWLFSDSGRGDLERAVASLPRGLCGVVFRHDGAPGRAALLRRVAAMCRARRLALVVAGGGAVPAGVGRHLRGGRGRSHTRGGGIITSSAHDRADMIRASRAGAVLVFVSPAFATLSHPGARSLGAVRWAGLARASRIRVLALGGITGRTVRRVPRWASGAGAIGALQP